MRSNSRIASGHFSYDWGNCSSTGKVERSFEALQKFIQTNKRHPVSLPCSVSDKFVTFNQETHGYGLVNLKYFINPHIKSLILMVFEYTHESHTHSSTSCALPNELRATLEYIRTFYRSLIVCPPGYQLSG